MGGGAGKDLLLEEADGDLAALVVCPLCNSAIAADTRKSEMASQRWQVGESRFAAAVRKGPFFRAPSLPDRWVRRRRTGSRCPLKSPISASKSQYNRHPVVPLLIHQPRHRLRRPHRRLAIPPGSRSLKALACASRLTLCSSLCLLVLRYRQNRQPASPRSNNTPNITPAMIPTFATMLDGPLPPVPAPCPADDVRVRADVEIANGLTVERNMPDKSRVCLAVLPDGDGKGRSKGVLGRWFGVVGRRKWLRR